MASAAILTGGRATRFGGRDKSALVVEGRRIIDRQLEELSRVTDDILIVGREIALPPGAAVPGAQTVRQIVDRMIQCGPLGGLDAAFAAARDAVVVALAGDMPFVTAPLLAHLLSLADLADAVVPRTKRGYHPLCAVYTRVCQPVVERRLARRQLALTGLFDEIRIHVVEVGEIEAFGDPDRLLANVNTADEHGEIESLRRHKV